MLKKSDIPQIIKVSIILFLITGISAFILAYANKVTKPLIDENNRIKQETAMKKVMPDAESFEENTGFIAEENAVVKKVYDAKAGGETVGYAVLSEPMGYNGAISMVVGISSDGVVTGLDITNQTETAGLGANCTNPEFTGKFEGKTAGIEVVKKTPGENQIDAMTSATITSKAVTGGVNAAIDAVKTIEEGK